MSRCWRREDVADKTRGILIPAIAQGIPQMMGRRPEILERVARIVTNSL
jgi:hypothetical protein